MTVENEVMGTQRVQMKGGLPWLVRWACRVSTRDACSALTARVGPVKNIFFFLTIYTISISLSLAHSKQAAVLSRLSLSMSLWVYSPFSFSGSADI